VLTVGDIYTHGHHESVIRSHAWRTAENSAGYLLPRLQPGQDLLDVGCGPGSITLDLARRVAPGRVVGIDSAPAVIDDASAAARAAGADNVTFRCEDAYEMDMEDASFDVVHAHQVLQHLRRPVEALVEMRRVLRPNGVLAVRDSDYAAFAWAPLDPMLDRWMALYHEVTRQNNAEADAGRFLLGWVQAAGFADAVATSSTWTFADPESRAWWGGLWADRVVLSSFADQAVSYGLSDAAELGTISDAWRRWAAAPDGWFAVLHAEVLAVR
jgi:ubiquinone/menaquinone biosynthesis C-methylase UbiE